MDFDRIIFLSGFLSGGFIFALGCWFGARIVLRAIGGSGNVVFNGESDSIGDTAGEILQ